MYSTAATDRISQPGMALLHPSVETDQSEILIGLVIVAILIERDAGGMVVMQFTRCFVILFLYPPIWAKKLVMRNFNCAIMCWKCECTFILKWRCTSECSACAPSCKSLNVTYEDPAITTSVHEGFIVRLQKLKPASWSSYEAWGNGNFSQCGKHLGFEPWFYKVKYYNWPRKNISSWKVKGTKVHFILYTCLFKLLTFSKYVKFK